MYASITIIHKSVLLDSCRRYSKLNIDERISSLKALTWLEANIKKQATSRGECMETCRGPFKRYVTQMGVGGGGGCQIFWKKALRRCKVQCY